MKIIVIAIAIGAIISLTGCMTLSEEKVAKLTDYSVPYYFETGQTVTVVATVKNIGTSPEHLSATIINENTSAVMSQGLTPMLIASWGTYVFVFHFTINQQTTFYGRLSVGDGNYSQDEVVNFMVRLS